MTTVLTPPTLVDGQADEPQNGEHPDADWFSPVIEFLVKHGMLDVQEEYGLEDILTALSDNYEPKPNPTSTEACL